MWPESSEALSQEHVSCNTAAPPVSLRELVRRNSYGDDDREAREVERTNLWKEAQTARKKHIQFGIWSSRTADSLQTLFNRQTFLSRASSMRPTAPSCFLAICGQKAQRLGRSNRPLMPTTSWLRRLGSSCTASSRRVILCCSLTGASVATARRSRAASGSVLAAGAC